ncbi:MAG: hypothetical protein HY862_06095 [Chloroflexi bacterium]|nr:hypothetical protein [Chloroflexota bacterium]
MPSELRICPHCGAAVSGDTKRCPRCDGLLEDISALPAPDEAVDGAIKTVVGMEPDYQARTVLDDQVLPAAPEAPKAEPAYVPMATVIDSQPQYDLDPPTAELERVLSEPPAEFKAEPPSASIFQAQTIVGAEDEPPAVLQEDSEPVGIVDSTPSEFQPPVAPPMGMKTMVDEKPPVGFSEARTEFFQQPPSPSATPIRGAVTMPADTASHPISRQPAPTPQAYMPQYAPPVPQPMPIPRAPYTAPPMQAMPPTMAYAAPARPNPMQNWGMPSGPSDYWLRQRTQIYLNGGYQLKGEGPGKITLAYGKRLGLIWWAAAVMSVIGFVWYCLILLFSGFRKDKVTIFLEPDGYVFEDGSGAAHVRIRRWRSARRWGVIGIILAVVSLLLFLMLVVAAYVIGNQYEAELEKAYPEVTFFQSTANEAAISQADVEMVRLIVLVLGILFVLAAIGTLGGAAVAVVSYVQAAAYHVDVSPLPGFW